MRIFSGLSLALLASCGPLGPSGGSPRHNPQDAGQATGIHGDADATAGDATADGASSHGSDKPPPESRTATTSGGSGSYEHQNERTDGGPDSGPDSGDPEKPDNQKEDGSDQEKESDATGADQPEEGSDAGDDAADDAADRDAGGDEEQDTGDVTMTGAELHVISIYEAVEGTFMQHVEGSATVTISSGKKVILALGSYEATSWKIVLKNGSSVDRVIAAGYYLPKVNGVSADIVDFYWHPNCGGGSTYIGYTGNAFYSEIEKITGLPVQSKQYADLGNDFTVSR